MDPNTNDLLPINTPGEVCTRGFNTMLGYWNDPEKTNETITKDRWLRSGYFFIFFFIFLFFLIYRFDMKCMIY